MLRVVLTIGVQTVPSQHVINQGEDGDNFYVIEHGLFDVYVNGVHIGGYENTGQSSLCHVLWLQIVRRHSS